MSHIGIEIGGTKIQIVAGNADGTFLERHRLAADRARGGAGIREQIASVVRIRCPVGMISRSETGFAI